MGGELIIETTSTSTTCVFSLMCKLIPLKSANIVALCMSVMITLTKPMVRCGTNCLSNQWQIFLQFHWCRNYTCKAC